MIRIASPAVATPACCVYTCRNFVTLPSSVRRARAFLTMRTSRWVVRTYVKFWCVSRFHSSDKHSTLLLQLTLMARRQFNLYERNMNS